MRKLVLFVPLAVLLTAVTALAADMTSYCQAPASVSTAVPPNILFILDITGSMSSNAYSGTYNPATRYEGYFDPEKDYMQTSGSSPVWEEKEVPDRTKICTGTRSCASNNASRCDLPLGANGCSANQSFCCSTNLTTISASGPYRNGNWLNFKHMTRIDVLRWSLTGGTPSGCSSSSAANSTVVKCDASQYGQPGWTATTGVPCDGIGCTLQTSSGMRLKARWDRITGDNGGLLYQLQNLSIQPRIGTMLYSDAPVIVNNATIKPVYIGDFVTSAADFDIMNPYKNSIAAINAQKEGGNTGTSPALWAAYAYFSQRASLYNGPAPQTSSATVWKNPSYQCIDKDGDGKCQTDEFILVPCAKNFVILLSDGEWNRGSTTSSTATASATSISNGWGINTATLGYTDPSIVGGLSADPVVPAYNLHKVGFRNALTGLTSRVETLYTIGLWLTGDGDAALKQTAMYGGFDLGKEENPNWPGNLVATGTYQGFPGTSSLRTPRWPSCSSDWTKDCTTNPPVPYNHLSADSATAVKDRITNIILDLMKRASSGTGMSSVGSGEGLGAVTLQTLFHPKRIFKSGEVAWTSDMMSYWYYVDPFVDNTHMREDTIREGHDFTLFDFKEDYITSFVYDAGTDTTQAAVWKDVNGRGKIASAVSQGMRSSLDYSRAIWRSGFNLWWTEPTMRTVFTSLNGSPVAFNAAPANSDLLEPYLGESGADAKRTINYALGYDCADATGAACACGATGCDMIGRNRTVTTGVCSVRKSPCESVTDCPSGETCNEETHVWKLGDIISSTPRIMGSAPLNNYHLKTSDGGYYDATYDRFVKSNDYQERQLVFSGTNGGMLHAFKMGKLLQKWDGKKWWEVAKLEGTTVPEGVTTAPYISRPGGIGTEAYAFIPKNVLPYLQYYKQEDYCHMSMVDGGITLVDVSIHCSQTDYWDCPKKTTMQADGKSVDFGETSWRTVLIGSMGTGGATCSGAVVVPDPDRIPAPLADETGLSSYFALDVTDQENPKLLWEFSNPNLGLTNVGAGIVKTGGGKAKRCSKNESFTCSNNSECAGTDQCVSVNTTNGRWFAVLASGATGQTGQAVNSEFTSVSNQNLRLFILDLKTGELLRTIDTGIANAFAAPFSSIDLQRSSADDDGNYQDDVIYIGYVQNVTQGGVLRLVIDNKSDPAQWTVSRVFAQPIGPVTSAVRNIIDRKEGKLWLYFGEGRYFHKQDDLGSQRRLFGVQESCFTATPSYAIDPACTNLLQLSDLQDQTTPTTLDASKKGWYIQLDPPDPSLGTSAERMISNPLINSKGHVYFLTFAPAADICSFGGFTYLWLRNYKGGPVKLTKGIVMVPLSTGEMQRLDIGSGLDIGPGARPVQDILAVGGKVSVGTGSPPPAKGNPWDDFDENSGSSKSVNRVMHIQEE